MGFLIYTIYPNEYTHGSVIHSEFIPIAIRTNSRASNIRAPDASMAPWCKHGIVQLLGRHHRAPRVSSREGGLIPRHRVPLIWNLPFSRWRLGRIGTAKTNITGALDLGCYTPPWAYHQSHVWSIPRNSRMLTSIWMIIFSMSYIALMLWVLPYAIKFSLIWWQQP